MFETNIVCFAKKCQKTTKNVKYWNMFLQKSDQFLQLKVNVLKSEKRYDRVLPTERGEGENKMK